MEPRNCKRCGRMFGYMGGLPICDLCKRKDEEDFENVRTYLKENPGATMREVSDACEVSVEKITRFLREGRLEVREGSNIVLECENCGRSIKRGRFCEACSKQLERDISAAASGRSAKGGKEAEGEEEKKRKTGMRYLTSDD